MFKKKASAHSIMRERSHPGSPPNLLYSVRSASFTSARVMLGVIAGFCGMVLRPQRARIFRFGDACTTSSESFLSSSFTSALLTEDARSAAHLFMFEFAEKGMKFEKSQFIVFHHFQKRKYTVVIIRGRRCRVVHMQLPLLHS